MTESMQNQADSRRASTMRTEERRYLLATSGLVLTCAVVALVPYLWTFWSPGFSRDPQVWDAFGGYIGGVLGALLSVVNLALILLIAVRVQRIQESERRADEREERREQAARDAERQASEREERAERERREAVAPSAKLWDRQNALDRLIVSDPTLAKHFIEMATRDTAYFTAPVSEVKRNENFYRLKAYCYLYLNFFEEIYMTTQASSLVAAQFEREDWDIFIFQYMRHSLLKELFEAEKDRAYTGEFVRFLTQHADKWKSHPADTDLF